MSTSGEQSLQDVVELTRAHSQINPYMSSPCHIEMILPEKEQIVPKPEEELAQKNKDIPEETEEIKTYGLGINFILHKIIAIKTNKQKSELKRHIT